MSSHCFVFELLCFYLVNRASLDYFIVGFRRSHLEAETRPNFEGSPLLHFGRKLKAIIEMRPVIMAGCFMQILLVVDLQIPLMAMLKAMLKIRQSHLA